MSIWTRIGEALSALAKGESLSHFFDSLKTPPERSVAFTIAVIGLGAKMAKADGLVTRDEVAAFRQVFHIPNHEEAQAAKVFNLARQDVAGFEVYANTISKMFKDDDIVLENLIEGLFYIAMADGQYHPSENDFVHTVATPLASTNAVFAALVRVSLRTLRLMRTTCSGLPQKHPTKKFAKHGVRKFVRPIPIN